MKGTLRECIEIIASEIAEAADRPRREAELMLMTILGRDQLWLITHQDAQVDCAGRLREWIERRKAHEPLEYIFNCVSFYSQLFYIAPGALIPRPETELLIDRVLERVDADAPVTLCEAFAEIRMGAPPFWSKTMVLSFSHAVFTLSIASHNAWGYPPVTGIFFSCRLRSPVEK